MSKVGINTVEADTQSVQLGMVGTPSNLVPPPTMEALEVEEVGEVSEMDLDSLMVSQDVGRPEKAPPVSLKQLRARHLQIARMIVAGVSMVQIAKSLDITVQTVSNLKNSPAFMALLGELNEVADKDFLQIGTRMRQLAMLGLDSLQQKVLEGEVSPEFIQDVVDDMLDRSGHPKVTETVTKTSHFSANATDLAALRNKVREGNADRVVYEGSYEVTEGEDLDKVASTRTEETEDKRAEVSRLDLREEGGEDAQESTPKVRPLKGDLD